MGGCGCRVMKSLYISRNDGAMRRVLKTINQGRHGSYLKIADTGRDELTNDLGVISKRVPDWLVSNEILRVRPPARKTTYTAPRHFVGGGHTC